MSNSWVVKVRYFKLVGKKEWFFKLNLMSLKGVESRNDIAVLKCYNAKIEQAMGEMEAEAFINKLMVNHGLKYVELSEDEVELLKLLYEV